MFSITLDDVKADCCALTGIKFELVIGTIKNRSFYAPSIDRIDSTKGYVPNNVRLILSGVNIMMNTWGPEKIIEIADAMRDYEDRKEQNEIL